MASTSEKDKGWLCFCQKNPRLFPPEGRGLLRKRSPVQRKGLCPQGGLPEGTSQQPGKMLVFSFPFSTCQRTEKKEKDKMKCLVQMLTFGFVVGYVQQRQENWGLQGTWDRPRRRNEFTGTSSGPRRPQYRDRKYRTDGWPGRKISTLYPSCQFKTFLFNLTMQNQPSKILFQKIISVFTSEISLPHI